MKPGKDTVIDFCCCAGGLTRGYQQAGFYVVGVDIEDQPNYCGDEFHHGDGLELFDELVDRYNPVFLHISAPCQNYSPLNAYNHKTYPALIEPFREKATATGIPWVMENVPQAPLVDPVILCGATLGLNMYRHRAFETGGGFTLTAPAHKPHVELCTRNGYVPTAERPFMTISGGKHSKAWLEAAKAAMGMPWVQTIREVCEAVPPAYAEWIGRQVLDQLNAESQEATA